MIVRPLPKENKYELIFSLNFFIGNTFYEVPAGFRFECSVPMFFRRVLPTPFQPKVMRAAAIHDYLYHNHICSRKEADKIFRETLMQDGVSKIVANIMYAGVRIGGWCAYNKGEKNESKN